jgi:predicted enzyme related to lactoylglutathione lyase
MVYFNVDDIDRNFQQALQAGAKEVVAPQDYPGGRFAILSDPHGATFGLFKSARR